MTKNPADYLFSKAIKSMQDEQGTADYIKLLIERNHWRDQLTTQQIEFIQSRDSFYLATASSDGMPYMQHRGGKKGFIKVPDSSTLYFPDYAGNRQYISTGNLTENDRAFLFFMDYPNQRRLKLWGSATLGSVNDVQLVEAQLPERGSVERIIKFQIDAIDENCPKHILKRYTDEEYRGKLLDTEKEIQELKNKIKLLEQNQK
jgi:predicted pyridoxine 5'-phosphate oxidase superfamily flavin-nucleotide-binding protein